MPELAWPTERVNKLAALLADGYSAGEAAPVMGCTRNAIMGVAHRKKLAFAHKSAFGRPRPASQRSATPRRSTPFRPKIRRLTNQGNRLEVVETLAPASFPVAEDVAEFPIPQRRSLLELTDKTCRWPIGDPGTAEFFFCGGLAIEGKPYCPHHCRMAYRQPGQREEQAA